MFPIPQKKCYLNGTNDPVEQQLRERAVQHVDVFREAGQYASGRGRVEKVHRQMQHVLQQKLVYPNRGGPTAQEQCNVKDDPRDTWPQFGKSVFFFCLI